jgi:hypothetical protein
VNQANPGEEDGNGKMYTGSWSKNLKGRHCWGDLGMDDMIISKPLLTFKQQPLTFK